MSNLPVLIAQHGETVRSAAQMTAGAVISGIWQGALLVTVTGLLLKVIPRTSATLRFIVWTAVFCVSAMMPLMSLARASRGTGAEAVATAHLQLDPRWSYALAGLWVAAALIRLGALAVQGLRLRSLWKSAVPVAQQPAGLSCGEALKRRRVELCTSTEVDRPSVIGFIAPRILIPAWLFEQLTEMELHHIVLHEMEHLRRRDDWVNLVQKLGLVLFPLNPALFWVDRRLSAERELACDDGVLEMTKTPRAYATCLTSIAERRLDHRLHRRIAALALGAIGSTGVFRGRSELSRRIEGILNRRSRLSPRAAGSFAALLVLGIVGGAAELAHAPQLVAFGRTGQSQQIATQDFSGMQPLPGQGRLTPGARYQNVSFRVPETAAPRAVSLVARRKLPQHETRQVAPSTTPSREAAPRSVSRNRMLKTSRQWVVLTSWQQVPASRVVIQLPDGQIFSAPYAAVPVQDGWLIVQL
jgi:beta-lactamase regulating signal transducer with metallopeptidase domain